MNQKGRVDGFSQLICVVSLRMSMSNWMWDSRTWNNLCHGGGFTDNRVPTPTELAVRLEYNAFTSGDYTQRLNEILQFIRPDDQRIFHLLNLVE